VGNIAEHPYEIQHIPPARHDDPDVVVSGHWILAAAIIGSSMAIINGTVANVALPSIQSDLGATRAEALWVVQAYALLLASLVLVGGSLGDNFGHRRVFVLGISIFTLGSVGCAVAASPGELIAARVVQALGAAGLIPGSLAVIGAAFEGERRGDRHLVGIRRHICGAGTGSGRLSDGHHFVAGRLFSSTCRWP
jgi:MFS family permease